MRLLLDFIIAGAALAEASWLRSLLPWLHGEVHAPTVFVCAAFAVILLLLASVHRDISPHLPERHVLFNCGLITLAVFLATLFSIRRIGGEVSRPTLFAFVVMLLVGLLVSHEMWVRWKPLGTARRPHNVIFVGDPALAAEWARAGKLSAWNIAAVLSDREPWGDEFTVAAVERAIRSMTLDAVVLAPSFLGAGPAATRTYEAVIEVCAATGTRLHVFSNWLGDQGRVTFDHYGPLPVLTFDYAPDALSWSLMAKRLLDIVVSAGLLVLAAPIMLFGAACIWCEDRGPVIFKQTRAGQCGRPFTIYKLRTMVEDAELRKASLLDRNQLAGPTFKMEHDPRLTRCGRWLRKASVDELPQLWNVLRGEMSLVGPRPHPVEEANAYARNHWRRLSMKPGITGLWQVSGRTSIPDFERWVELDVEYIRRWSLWLDATILARTVVAVLRMTGR